MRKEKLKQIHNYINELKTVRRTLIEPEYINIDGKLQRKEGFINVEKYRKSN